MFHFLFQYNRISHFFTGPDDTYGNLAAIGNRNFIEHGISFLIEELQQENNLK